jgi:hypothetical protein
VGTVLNVVKKVTSSVGASAQKVLAPAQAGTAARPTGSGAGAAPTTSAAAPVRSGSAARSTGQAAGTGITAPAAYGTNPHGQGTVAGLQLPPTATIPYPYSIGGSGGEILVLGRGRSEQQANGTYDAHTTIAALLGTELLGVNATQGQTNTGPLNALQTAVLDKICQASSQAICLQVLAADTAATATGATTHFAVATIGVGGAMGLQTGIAQADSSIQTSGSCQTASGSSQAANIKLAGGQVVGVGKSSESSTACAGQTPTQTASSSVISLAGTGVGLPAAGCANGTPNTSAGLLPLLNIICNADNTTELAAPSGVRQALTVIALQLANSALLKTTVVASESHAVAPAATPPSSCTDSDKDCGKGPPLINSGGAKCKGYPADTVDNDGDCDAGYQSKGGVGAGHHKKKKTGTGGQKCTDSDHDCGKGPPGTGSCTNDVSDHDGDCVLPGGGSEVCTDSDHDCGKGPAGTGTCTNDIVDSDGDCALAGGGSETGGATATAKTSNLPFTGENVLEVILIGLVLAGGGLGLAARTRKRSQ